MKQPQIKHQAQFLQPQPSTTPKMSSPFHDLVARGIFKNDGNGTCRSFAADSHAEPITGDLLLHQLMWYIAAGCAGFAILTGTLLTILHISHYREPHVQRQLIRILWTSPIFAIFSFLAVFSYHITEYMVPIIELYEAFAMVSVFFLMLWHLSHTTNLDDQIRIVTAIPYTPTKKRDRGPYTPAMFRITYIAVLQTLPVHIITTIAAWIVTATKCTGSDANKHWHTAISLIDIISVVICIGKGELPFLFRFKNELRQADPKIFFKLLAFKAIVILTALQQFVFKILDSTGTLDPTRTMSYSDLNMGLNSFVTAIEAAIFCVLLIPAFWPREFREKRYLAATQGELEMGANGGKYHSNGQVVNGQGEVLAPRKVNFFRAVLHSVNMIDVIQAVGRAVKLLGKKL